MAQVIIRTNAAQPSLVVIGDAAIEVEPFGGSVTIDALDALLELAESTDLVELCQDNAFGAGSSTLILNDGISDIDQGLVDEFLSTSFITRSGPFSAVLRDEAGLLDTSVETQYRVLIWAEESGALSSGRQWSFGNGATGDIGIPAWEDGDIVGMVLNTENAAGSATVAVTLNSTQVGTVTINPPDEDVVTIFPSPIAFVQGDRIGFSTVSDTGRSDARVGAILEFTSELSAVGVLGPDEQVRISATDTTSGFLLDKLIATGRIGLAQLSVGANEQLEISVTDPTAAEVSYDNLTSGLTSTNVQDAIDEVVSGGLGGIDEAAHEALDTLVHQIAEDSFTEVTYDAFARITDIITWTDAGKTVKIREKNVTYVGLSRRISTYTAIQYDAAGVETSRIETTYTYSGLRLLTGTTVRTP
jgi:hypothetical protein